MKSGDDGSGSKLRAVPDRRQQPRLPGVLRAAGGDVDRGRAADERDLRVRVDAGQAVDRAHTGGRDRRLGRRACRVARRSTSPTRRSAGRAPTCCRSSGRHLEPIAEAFGFRNIRVKGYEADDVIAALVRKAQRGWDPGDGRVGRSRRLPAGRRRRSRDDHLARDHRHAGLRPRWCRGALRRAPRARPRPDRAQGRHLGQHPRRSGRRRQDRGAATAALRLARGRARQRRRDLGGEAQAEPDRARRGRPDLEAARDPPVRHRYRARPLGADGLEAGPQPAARGGTRVRAAPGHPAAGRGAARGRSRGGRRGADRGRGQRGCDRRPRTPATWRSPSATDRWAASDGERVVAGDSPSSRAWPQSFGSGR